MYEIISEIHIIIHQKPSKKVNEFWKFALNSIEIRVPPKLKNTGEKKIDRVLWTWGSMAQPVGKAIWLVATQIFLEFSLRTLGFHDPTWRAYYWNHQLAIIWSCAKLLRKWRCKAYGNLFKYRLDQHWPFSRHFCLPPGKKGANTRHHHIPSGHCCWEGDGPKEYHNSARFTWVARLPRFFSNATMRNHNF